VKLLVDTDAFCKLMIGSIFEDAVHLLGAKLSECGRLPALPYMLRRGKLPTQYGKQACTSWGQIADRLPEIVQPGDRWLEPLAQIDNIDVGEAQLFAAAARYGLRVLSGDKRALRALKGVASLHAALSGRIVVLDAVLIALCDRLGSDEIRKRVQPLTATDPIFRICFSNPASDPRDCLRFYFDRLIAEVDPLILWKPPLGGRK
jgi:hypothetical protein